MAHRKWIFLSLLVIWGSLSQAAEPTAPAIGLVELPTIFGRSDSQGPPGQIAPVTTGDIPVHAEPSNRSTVIARLTDPRTVASAEFDFEELAALVYGKSGGWFQVALHDRSDQRFGWIAPEHAGNFYALEDLVADKFSFLTHAWNSGLYDRPAGTGVILPVNAALAQTPDINVLQVIGNGKDAWLLVEVLSRWRCEELEASEEPRTVANGWVKLHAASGHVNAGYSSRRC